MLASLLAIGLGIGSAFRTVLAAEGDPASDFRNQFRTNRGIELPFGPEFFPGEGINAELANEYCLLCHSTEMVTTQPPLSLNTWKAEIHKMRTTFGCPLPARHADSLAKYMFDLNHQDEKR